ncbi:MAG: hypothetical protein LBL58_10235 [Tannerellaceae bacterium]|jgi:hypothetical protein|nr:hypothetical protein [Tannerellaceae bacterium]
MSKISNKTFKKLHHLIDETISLGEVERKLFAGPPDMWDEIEKQICDYQTRISRKSIAEIAEIFGIPGGSAWILARRWNYDGKER